MIDRRDASIRHRSGRLPSFVGATLLLASCASSRPSSDGWVYAMSREFYNSSSGSGLYVSGSQFSNTCGSSEGEALAILCIYALPFVLDTVVLPITIPHDLFVMK